MEGFPMTFFLQTQVLMHVDRKSDLMAVHTCGPVLSFTLPSPCTTSSQAFSVNAFWWRIQNEWLVDAHKTCLDYVTWNASSTDNNEA